MSETHQAVTDGRTARRLRNRQAVIDAMIDLVAAGSDLPEPRAVADRAGVSVASVFRYFDGMDDLKDEAIERYFARYAELFRVPHIGQGSLHERITAFADARARLYPAVAPIGRLARARAFGHARMAVAVERARGLFIDQLRRNFAPELERLESGEAAELLASLDALTSFESWDLQHTSHGRSTAQIRDGWINGLGLLLAASPPGADPRACGGVGS